MAHNAAVISKTYLVSVTNGHLDVGISGGTNSVGVIDGMQLVKDTSPLLVTSTVPSNGANVSGNLTSVQVTFNHPVSAATVDSSNSITLTNPSSTPITFTNITQVNSNTVSLNFASQSTPGSYTLTVGAGTQDVGGNTMSAGNAVTAVFNKVAVTGGAYDFGTPASPVATGYTPVYSNSGYSAAAGFGWLSSSGPIVGYDTGNTTATSPDPKVTEDFNYTQNATFAVDVANGTYDVKLTLGDVRGTANINAIYFNGSSTATDTVLTGGSNPSVISRAYVVTVTNGQIDVQLKSNASNQVAVIDGLSFVTDSGTPFTITGTTPTSGTTLSTPLNQISIAFSHVLAANATTASNYVLTGPSGAAIPLSVSSIDNKDVSLSFANQTTPGNYTLTVLGNGVQDSGGLTLGSNATFTFSEPLATSGAFDFGTSSSPVATGYTQVTQSTAYSTSAGYGWTAGIGSIYSLDTGVTTFTNPDPKVTEDLNYTQNATFAVGVPNGTYDVTVTAGDARANPDSTALYFQGSTSATDTILTGSSNPGVASRIYVITVSNGQLKLNIKGNGTNYAVLDGLSFVPDTGLAFQITGTTPTSGSSLTAPFNNISVVFSQPVTSSTTSASNYTITGPGNVTIPITGITMTDSKDVNITFANQGAGGTYTLAVSGGIQDTSGVSLGASPTFNWSLPPSTSGAFDFGTSVSPVAAGYSRVTESTLYSAATGGYGWTTSGTQYSYDTGILTNPTPDVKVTEDFNYTQNGTFNVVVPNGVYDVRLTVGDIRANADTNTIYFNGSSTATDNILTGGSNPGVISKTYVITVSNSLLSVQLKGTASQYAVIDGLSFVPDTGSMFTVTGTTPASGTALTAPISQVSVAFNHAVGANALTTSDYSLVGPSGAAIVITSVTQVDSKDVTLNFAAQSTPGTYTLTISGNTQDSGGLTLGSNVVSTFSEPAATSGAFDFGPLSSPTASGYIRIDTSAYTATRGYGWLSGPVVAGDVGTNSYTNPDPNVTRAFVYVNGPAYTHQANAPGIFGVNVANGTYDVTLTIGDARGNADSTAIFFEGSSTATDTILTGASNPGVINKTYVVNVTNGQLTVAILGNGTQFAVIDGLSFVSAATPFVVNSTTPTGGSTVTAPFSQISLAFSHPVNAAAFTASGYVLTGPGSTPITITSVTALNSSALTLNFAGQVASGTYTLVIQSTVQDVNGNSVSGSSTYIWTI